MSNDLTMQTFVHLNLGTEYSITDSIVKISDLCALAKKNNMPAVAMTDHCNLFGMVKFYKTALKNGVKPIIGAKLYLNNPNQDFKYSSLIVLCKDQAGFHNLSVLISKAYTKGSRFEHPLIDYSWLKQYSDGLIILLGDGSVIGKQLNKQNIDIANDILKELKGIFKDNLYIEITRLNVKQKSYTRYEEVLLNLAQKHDLPLVATNKVLFLEKDDFDAFKARFCISNGLTLNHPEHQDLFSKEQYFKTNEQIFELFRDLPSSIANTVEISKRCNLMLELGNSVLPSFPTPNHITEPEYLKQISYSGLNERLAKKFAQENIDEASRQKLTKIYEKRLEIELEVINNMGFPGYFLIVADFIGWAKKKSIPVGPGRGSGAGSLVAYALLITDLDPIEYDLLFERFLNPERVSMPDFDIDFCMEGRDRVIEYVANKYGRNCVSQIATFGTMAAKAVVRDVGRVLGYPYGFVDKIAKLIPFEIGMTLAKALKQEENLLKRYNEEEEVKHLIDLAKKLEGVARNVGKHAGGVVIAPNDLTAFTPLYCEQGSANIVTQFDKDDVEAIGLVKFDFLGLRTLTIIDWAVRNINQILSSQNKQLFDIEKIIFDDEKTFQLLQACNTTAVFQLESRGMKDLIKRLKPDLFEEIIALVALFRPGPLQSGMVDDFINIKHGRQKAEYPDPRLEPILKSTYGVILYQEQVMQIAQDLAGYTLGGADLLRRAMGKKKPEEMAKQRAIFVKGATKNNVSEDKATYIFDLMEKFAGYGFNKSHSAAYAYLSYQTAYLKAHYPSCFMAAVLSADLGQTDKVVILLKDCKDQNITVLPPDINTSYYEFTVNAKLEIVYGLGAIKGVGQSAIEGIVAAREQNKFSDLYDFCARIDLKKANKRTIENLIKAGCFDNIEQNRAKLLSQLEDAVKYAEQLAKNKNYGQADLFQDCAIHSKPIEPSHTSKIIPLSFDDRLAAEKESLGFYLSGHPLDPLESELKSLKVKKSYEVVVKPNNNFYNNKKSKTRRDPGTSCMLAGIITNMRTLITKKGDRMAFLSVDEKDSQFEMAVFSDIYQKYRELIVKDELVIIEAQISIDPNNQQRKISAKSFYNVAMARKLYAKQLLVKLPQNNSSQYIEKLQLFLQNIERGESKVSVKLFDDNQQDYIKLNLNDDWNIKISDQSIKQIKDLIGEDAVEIIY